MCYREKYSVLVRSILWQFQWEDSDIKPLKTKCVSIIFLTWYSCSRNLRTNIFGIKSNQLSPFQISMKINEPFQNVKIKNIHPFILNIKNIAFIYSIQKNIFFIQLSEETSKSLACSQQLLHYKHLKHV